MVDQIDNSVLNVQWNNNECKSGSNILTFLLKYKKCKHNCIIGKMEAVSKMHTFIVTANREFSI